MALSVTLYQPYSPTRYLRGYVLYDPRGNAFPYLYSFSQTRYPDNANLWTLNRQTGVLTEVEGDFNPWSSLGPPDMDADANLWWVGNEPDNLTNSFQAQTKFAADTFAKIGSMTSDGSTIVYAVSGEVRVDRQSSFHLVAEVERGGGSLSGRVRGWDGITRVRIYDLNKTNWVYAFVDYDFDAAGNLWVLSGDLTHTLLKKVSPAGAVSTVVDLSGSLTNPMALKYLAADNSFIVASKGTTILKWNIVGGAIAATLTVPAVLDEGLGEQRSFHHTLDAVTDIYIFETLPSQVFLYQVDLLNMANGTATDFYGAVQTAGAIFNGFNQVYGPTSYKFHGGASFYDPVDDAVWIEEANSGCIGRFAFGGAAVPEMRTTQILAELVLRPHPPSGPVLPPPPMVFTGRNLFALTGPAQPMEVCSGYIGKPPVHSQLSQVEAHYNKELAPLDSQLHVFHTEQIGETDIKGRPGVIWKENPWFNVRQTDRYHRACLFCKGDTEVTALTWMLREAGIR